MAQRDEARDRRQDDPEDATERPDLHQETTASRRGFVRWSAGIAVGAAALIGLAACGGDDEDEDDEDGEQGDEEGEEEGD